ncbi:hypothetical protein C5E45_10330 [Nocardia nova]|uniref:Uncharacterized protein n=1 Tax=Nocardia nova TaxID=37330 RepID=A0A2S6ASH8_9NOCA|nr:hypothetical protein C5E45_10330 [Nocardia nova]
MRFARSDPPQARRSRLTSGVARPRAPPAAVESVRSTAVQPEHEVILLDITGTDLPADAAGDAARGPALRQRRRQCAGYQGPQRHRCHRRGIRIGRYQAWFVLGRLLHQRPDVAEFLVAKQRTDPGSPMLRWMATASPIAADGTAQSWGTAHRPATIGTNGDGRTAAPRSPRPPSVRLRGRRLHPRRCE